MGETFHERTCETIHDNPRPWAFLVGARTLLVAPGIAARSKKLLVTRQVQKDADPQLLNSPDPTLPQAVVPKQRSRSTPKPSPTQQHEPPNGRLSFSTGLGRPWRRCSRPSCSTCLFATSSATVFSATSSEGESTELILSMRLPVYQICCITWVSQYY